MIIGLWVIAGIVAFLIVEKFVRYTHGQTEGGSGGHSHSHSHSHSTTQDEKDRVINNNSNDSNLHQRKKSQSDNEEKKNNNKNGNEKKEKKKDEPLKITAAGYLNLVADFTHNFTDGLAIGASFLVSKKVIHS